MEIAKLGSLYFGGNPVKIGSKWDKKPIIIGDTDPAHPLSWVKVGNLLVADRVICTAISWDDLNKTGFIFGRPVQIDGISYLCKSLKVGNQKGTPNEWDAILDQTTEDNNIWHWRKTYFWGQEAHKDKVSLRAVRGDLSARYWCLATAANLSTGVGFRPVLEKIFSDSLVSDDLIGSSIKVYGPGMVVVSGELTEVSEYDLILKSKDQASGAWCSILQDGIVAVDRSAIIYTSLT